MAKKYDPEQLTIDYFKDFEYNASGPGTGGHIYSDIKYCHPDEIVFAQNGRSDSKGIEHLVQVHALYCALFKRRYAHEDILFIHSHEIPEKPGCWRVYVMRDERCYYQDETTPESNIWPAPGTPADRFLSMVEFDEDGKMTLMSDFFQQDNYKFGSAIPIPTNDEIRREMIACGGGDFTYLLDEKMKKAVDEIYRS